MDGWWKKNMFNFTYCIEIPIISCDLNLNKCRNVYNELQLSQSWYKYVDKKKYKKIKRLHRKNNSSCILHFFDLEFDHFKYVLPFTELFSFFISFMKTTTTTSMVFDIMSNWNMARVIVIGLLYFVHIKNQIVFTLISK